ncbi:hypothetical protein BL250_12650 [Erwinia sp. OLTSP20]|uniref:hypothetical protein n=1 Tax=unclassified Erwinia TaxID=2622719 RepID=UPI000C18E079|nr:MULTISPECIES: hypothetical protein [unclassified Erwinia]PIJ50234.1 hypothetical protein BV501_09160 [Erwinia sp. OAMSP11]PIJ72071.1 hypothetical protein BK416_10060 [Erwinia sp. OLSSP12]PIJ81362.1 hypothetical protein BLD47_08885 [Erwinia sp. OLCASP19]PIJ84068.1 hypothetical protein BLD46_08465 [Erwinia sp. OLMTSP26]PIJ85767.1 hypothetical protein BLD49_09685 [Erwinia sp. OLMDSP33]
MSKFLFAVLCGTFLSQQVLAATLNDFARHYGGRCATPAARIDSERLLPAKFRSRNFPIVLERTTLKDIQQQFKGEIQKNDGAEWLCYHSQAENLTWWFISRTDIEHGNLSSIMLSAIDHKAHCDVPARPIYLSGVTVPSLGATRREIADYFRIAPSTHGNCQQFETRVDSKDESTANVLQYYYEENHVSGMAFEQLTTNG